MLPLGRKCSILYIEQNIRELEEAMVEQGWVKAADAAVAVGRKPSTVREIAGSHPAEIQSREQDGVFWVHLPSLKAWYDQKKKRDEEAKARRQQLLLRRSAKSVSATRASKNAILPGTDSFGGLGAASSPVSNLERRSNQVLLELVVALTAERDELRRLLEAANTQILQLKKRT